MNENLVDQLVSAWNSAVAATTPDACDRAVEQFLTILVRQGRGRVEDRRQLTEPSFLKQFANGALRAMLNQLGPAVQAWYEGRFEDAAAALVLFTQNRVVAPSGHPLRALCTAHACTWGAASYTRAGKFRQARQLLVKAEKALAGDNYPDAQGWLHHERARLAYWRQDVAAAASEFTLAEAHFSKHRNGFALAELYGSRARLLTHEGMYALALEQLELAQAWREPDDALERAKGRFYAARIFRFREEHHQAIELLRQALDEIRPLGNLRWEANVRDVLGDVYLLAGRLDEAKEEFSARVFRRRDPVTAERARYQQAKLQVEQALRMPTPLRQQRALGDALPRCELLARQGQKQMIGPKACLLVGRLRRALGESATAAKWFRRAAEGFESAEARWYRAESLYQVGEALLAADQPAAAAPFWLRSLQTAVDDVQRDRTLAGLKTNFTALGTTQVCAALAELYAEQIRQREGRVIEQQAWAQFVGASQQLNWLARIPLRHLVGNIPEALESHSYAEIRKMVVGLRNEVVQLLDQQDLLWKQVPLTRALANWLPLAEAVQEALGWPEHDRRLKPLLRKPQLGILADHAATIRSLRAFASFAATWMQEATCTVQLDRERGSLQIQWQGQRPPVDNSRLSSLLKIEAYAPSLAAFDVTPNTWAALLAAKLQWEALGGHIDLLSMGGDLAPLHRYTLTAKLSVETIP